MEPGFFKLVLGQLIVMILQNLVGGHFFFLRGNIDLHPQFCSTLEDPFGT